ncbi:MAG: 5,6-dimethylbenzimidazole synthase [Thaumarchaeota archaeon]|nr:5,6-dimethylbenzimidazole synthase [Nitrososphaerota archaeon]MDD9813516.1 5,6-dimethylbenzimidazole synthase [Nitrososphaerota archaeon]MDD9825390.1 5,6-dimethylbenzimidazole synthase [Nitrososphaerota archaeon]
MGAEMGEADRRGLYRAIRTRRDVRSHFVRRPIGDAALARILGAAHHAPSVGYSQPWDFVLVREGPTRRRVRESFEAARAAAAAELDGPRREAYESLKLEGILESDLNVCVTYDASRSGPFVIGRSSMPEAGVYSVCCAVQNLWLAARAEGIGVGWVSILSKDDLREILGLPGGIEPVAYLCLGHVGEFAARPDLEEAGWLGRVALGDVVHYGRWGGRAGGAWAGLPPLLARGIDYA